MPEVKPKKKRSPVTQVRQNWIQARHWANGKVTESGTLLFEDPGDTEVSEVMGPFEGPSAVAHVAASVTMNLGNYQSAKVEYGATVPCLVEELPQAWEFAYKLADQRMKEKVASIREYISKRS